MFHTIRWRLSIPWVFMILILMSVLFIYVSGFLRDVQIEHEQEQLRTGAQLIGEAIAASLADDAVLTVYDPFADRYARLLNARVTIIDLDGTILGESHRARGGLSSALSRLEVRPTANQESGDCRWRTHRRPTLKSPLKGSFILRCHRATSPQSTSSSWWAVGAVQGITAPGLVESHQRRIQASRALLPTPCPERIARRRLPPPRAAMISSCWAVGLAPITLPMNSRGSRTRSSALFATSYTLDRPRSRPRCTIGWCRWQ